MATSAPPGMEWQSYFSNFNSLSDALDPSKKKGITSQLLGHAINAIAGGSNDFASSLIGSQPTFGATAAVPQGAVPSPTTTPVMAVPSLPAVPPVAGQPQIGGQPMMPQTQPGTTVQQPMNQTPSYSRFLFSSQ